MRKIFYTILFYFFTLTAWVGAIGSMGILVHNQWLLVSGSFLQFLNPLILFWVIANAVTNYIWWICTITALISFYIVTKIYSNLEIYVNK